MDPFRVENSLYFCQIRPLFWDLSSLKAADFLGFQNKDWLDLTEELIYLLLRKEN